MARSGVTIVELATALGLSKSTVSDALRGAGRVAPETVAAVVRAADELGYVSNRAARQLRGSATGALGLYIPPAVRNFGFYMEFAFGAANAAAAAGCDLMLFARESDVGPRHFQVDGVLAIDPMADDTTLLRIIDSGIPVVTAGRADPTVADRVVAVVEIDHREVANQVLDHLADRGVTRPAYIGADQTFHSSWATDVRDSYLDWCARRGIEPALREVVVTANAEELAAVVREVTELDGVDALVTGPQGFAGRAQPVLEAAGRRIGDGFRLASLIGDPVTELSSPVITAVDPHAWAFGSAGIETLAEVLNSPPTSPVYRRLTADVRTAPID